MKEFLKKILPMPYRTMQKIFNQIKKLLVKQTKILKQQTEILTQQKKQLGVTQKKVSEMQAQVSQMQVQASQIQEQDNRMQTQMNVIEQNQREIKDLLAKIYAASGDVSQKLQATWKAVDKDSVVSRTVSSTNIIAKAQNKTANEILWANIFNNAVSGSSWLKNQAFYPGRWAIGYPVLYVLYRILNEVQPKKILELGLGQSTRMIAQYAAFHDNVVHYVVEHDEEWIHFFERDTPIPENTSIVHLETEIAPYLDAEEVRQYQNFQGTFENQQFDLIFIDAPIGGDMKLYARVDILKLIPDAIPDSFIIMMDDFNRLGEQNTGKLIESAFEKYGIAYKRGVYSGQKDVVMYVSEDNAFLNSM